VAIARVQTGTAATTTGTGTVTPTLPAGATAGNIIIAIIGVNAPTTAPTINSGGGATNDSHNETGSACCSAVFSKVAAGGETNIGAFTLSTGTRDMYGLLLEYSGLTNATPDVIQNAGSATTSTTPNTGTTAGSTAQAVDLCISSIQNINTTTATAQALIAGSTITGGTATKLGEATSGNATAAQKVTGRSIEYISTGAGTVGLQITLATARAYSGAIATYKEAGAAAAASLIAPTGLTPAMRSM
jgi:hypothetical protein